MDVLKPELVWIEGRCYRKLPIDSVVTESSRSFENSTEDESIYNGFSATQQNEIRHCTNDEPCDAPTESESKDEDENVNIEQTARGLSLKLDIPNAYFRFIIGKGGEMKRRLEAETQTTIHVPRFQEKGPIIVNARSRENILCCRRKMLNLVDSARQRQQPTHFLSIPFNSPEIQSQAAIFKETILDDFGHCRGIDREIILDPPKLHLTIAMMVLMSDSEREEASKALQQCREQIIAPFFQTTNVERKTYELRGVEYMNDDPSEVDVLYAKIQASKNRPPQELQKLVNDIADFFASKNLVVRSRDSVKMHVTLMNTRYRNKDDEDSFGRRRETFDARQIIQNFQDYYFGSQVMNCVHISQRHATSDDGYYSCTSRVDF